MKQEQNCGSCRYFHNQVRTWCVRFPPVPIDGRTAYFPAVSWDNACGEWQGKPDVRK